MKQTNFDLAIIGAGSAGLSLATTASDLGASVVLIEQRDLGGTCVNRGCVPKKLLWHASRIRSEHASMFNAGLIDTRGDLQFNILQGEIARKLGDIRQSFHDKLKEKGVDVLSGEAKLCGRADAFCVRVNEQDVSAGRVVLATGAKPKRLDIIGANLLSVSDDVFAWNSVPETLLILGGGYIGCEFACIMSAFGSQVTLATTGKRLLEQFDEDAVSVATQNMKRQGVVVKFETSLEQVIASVDGTIDCKLTDGEALTVERVLCAIGREPNLECLKDFPIAIESSKTGALTVDERFQTSLPNLFAIGDVADRLPLTPVATKDGESLARMLFGSSSEQFDLQHAAKTAFLMPPISQIGRSQIDWEQDGVVVKVHSSTSQALHHGVLTDMVKNFSKSFYKITSDRASGDVLSTCLVDDSSPDQIAWSALSLLSGLQDIQFGQVAAVHPTFAEELIGK